MKGKEQYPGFGVIMCMPSRGRPCIETLKSFGNTDGDVCRVLFMEKSRVGIIEARNELVLGALKAPSYLGFEPKLGWYVLWVDDDAFWQPGTIKRLLGALQYPEIDIVAGWFSGRSYNSPPKAIRVDGTPPDPGKPGEVMDGGLAEVDRCGFHFVLHPLSVFEKVGPNPFNLEGTDELGEDFAFCRRARNAGLRIWVHSGAPVWHVDDDGSGTEDTGLAYLPGVGPFRIVGGDPTSVASIRKYGGLDEILDQKRRAARPAVVLK